MYKIKKDFFVTHLLGPQSKFLENTPHEKKNGDIGWK